ncbi:MAG TPA: hypothetical protein VJ742_12025 [Nitrososphaera sp.]|nr:hypothetical protein [Nitrososphaera sp.]
MSRYFDEYDDALLKDYVFDSNLSVREIAQNLEATKLEVTKRIRELGLSWIRKRSNGHVSRGQAALTNMMRKLLPGETIVNEEPIGNRLRLDVYCPKFKLAAEYHGRQHFYYVEHFHRDIEGFRESQRRDERKLEICKNLGIVLVVFRYTDLLDEDAVFERLLWALREAPEEKVEPVEKKVDPYYQAQLQRKREYRREAYRRMKKQRHG